MNKCMLCVMMNPILITCHQLNLMLRVTMVLINIVINLYILV